MPPTLTFTLPDRDDGGQLIHELEKAYEIIKIPRPDTAFTFYDTFDWRLFNKSLCLFSSGNTLFLRRLFQTEIRHTCRCSALPVLIDDFPECGLKELLAPIVKARALLRLVEVHRRATLFRILNPDKKTVVRLIYEKFLLASQKEVPPLAICLSVEPVKGYPKHCRRLTRRLQSAGCEENREDIYFPALASTSQKPGDYFAKIDLGLDPRMPSQEAAKAILHFLLQIIKTNEPYLARDIDTEFLHDYRVAIRRTRSALGQIKDVFVPEATERFKKDLAFAGKLTNQLRDLDVYLLKEKAYKSMLPPFMCDDIDPFFAYLREKRSEALKEVLRNLRSQTYQQIFTDWETFLEAPSDNSSPAANAALPIINLARKRITKRYRSIKKAGHRIVADNDEDAMHALRIECKKLRYLMEFFSSLFPRSKMNLLIGQLKKLQDNLGDFHDICVQQEYLLATSNELPLSDGRSRKTLVAIGSLVESLDGQKKVVKDAFSETFSEFASPKNSRLFRKLFVKK